MTTCELTVFQSSRKWIGFCSAPSGGRGFTSEPRGSRTSSHRLTSVCWTGASLTVWDILRHPQTWTSLIFFSFSSSSFPRWLPPWANPNQSSPGRSHQWKWVSWNLPPPTPAPASVNLSVAGGGLIDQLHTHSSDGGLWECKWGDGGVSKGGVRGQRLDSNWVLWSSRPEATLWNGKNFLSAADWDPQHLRAPELLTPGSCWKSTVAVNSQTVFTELDLMKMLFWVLVQMWRRLIKMHVAPRPMYSL